MVTRSSCPQSRANAAFLIVSSAETATKELDEFFREIRVPCIFAVDARPLDDGDDTSLPQTGDVTGATKGTFWSVMGNVFKW